MPAGSGPSPCHVHKRYLDKSGGLHTPQAIRDASGRSVIALPPIKRNVHGFCTICTPQAICDASGCSAINLDDSGRCEVVGPNKAAAAMAVEYVQLIASDPEPGAIFRSRKVVSIQVCKCASMGVLLHVV